MLPKVIQVGTKAEIRLMDNLMRKANLAYPRISPYRVSQRAGNKNIDAHFVSWIDKIGAIVDAERMQDAGKRFLDIIFGSTKSLKKTHLGDCAESSSLIMSSLLANGYKDGKIARLFFEAEARDLSSNQVVGKKMFDTTHEFVVRHLDKNAVASNPKTYGKNLIVIDAWEGFCGNLQESFKRYYDTFWGGMREWINKDANVKITYKPQFHFCDFGAEATEKDMELFRNAFSDLIIKK